MPKQVKAAVKSSARSAHTITVKAPAKATPTKSTSSRGAVATQSHVVSAQADRKSVAAIAPMTAAAAKKSRKGLRDAFDPNVHKRLASDRISADLADFQRAGGAIEKLGVTKVLLKITAA